VGHRGGTHEDGSDRGRRAVQSVFGSSCVCSLSGGTGMGRRPGRSGGRDSRTHVL
jgi:hypothetical protein